MSAVKSNKLYIYFFLLLSIFPVSLFSQETNTKYSLKIYSYFSYSESGSETGVNPLEVAKNVDFGRFAPALQLKSSTGNFQEIELNRFTVNHELYFSQNRDQNNELIETLEGEISNHYQLSVGYEYNYCIIKKSKKFHPYIGVSALPGIEYLRTTPIISSEYKSDLFNTNIWIQFIPRIIIDLSDRYFLDINLPVSIGSLYWSVLNADNPNLPINERKTSTVGFDAPGFRGRFNLRFGLGIRL